VPQREVTIRLNDKMWFNSEIRREIRKRDRLRKLARRSNSDSNINKYKKERNHVNNLKKDAKEQFYFSVNTLLDDFSSSNSKSYWSLINDSRTSQLSYTKTGSSKDWRVLHVLVGSVIMFFQIIQPHKIK
jgi:hypothetical protein